MAAYGQDCRVGCAGLISFGHTALPRNETLKRGVYSLDDPDRMRRYQNVLSLLPGRTSRRPVPGRNHSMPESGDAILESWAGYGSLCPRPTSLGGFSFLELRSTLPDELLMYADKLSMAHGLELRVPYVDKEIVEYVERLPAKFKVRNGSGKWLHRQVCQEPVFLQSILKRPKRGFAVNVVDDWFRGTTRQRMDGDSSGPRLQIYQYLRPSAVSKFSSNIAPAGRTITKSCLAWSFLRNGCGRTKSP